MGRPRIYDPVSKTCEVCGTGFLASSRHQVESQKVCSRTCSQKRAWKTSRKVDKVEKDCRVCGKLMELNPSLEDVRFTCSAECRGVWQTESGSHAGENSGQWRGGSETWWKAKARERDDYMCKLCGFRDRGKKTHAHHIVPRAAGGPDSLDNLITLCNRCHREKEHEMLMTLASRFPDDVRDIAMSLFPTVSGEVDLTKAPAFPYKKKWIAKQRENGGCVECAEPAIPGQTLCIKHRDGNKTSQERYKQRKLTSET